MGGVIAVQVADLAAPSSREGELAAAARAGLDAAGHGDLVGDPLAWAVGACVVADLAIQSSSMYEFTPRPKIQVQVNLKSSGKR